MSKKKSWKRARDAKKMEQQEKKKLEEKQKLESEKYIVDADGRLVPRVFRKGYSTMNDLSSDED